MPTLKEKLKLTFDPTKIEPVPIVGKEIAEMIELLEKLELTQVSKYESMMWSTKESMRRSMKYSMWELVSDSIITSESVSTLISMREVMWDFMLELIKDSVWDSVADSIQGSMWSSMWDSMRDFMLAALMVTLSKKEYEELFKGKVIPKEISYEKVIELCEKYHKISKMGYFPHRGIQKGEYLLAPWKNPEDIVRVRIFER